MPLSRRDALKASAASAVGFWASGTAAALTPRSKLEKLRIAGIGVGGKGYSDIMDASQFGDVVAVCDIDDKFCDKAATDLAAKGQKTEKFFDFRKMLEKMGGQIDAVVVSTPDHTHTVASVMAMKMGKHVYCQKPLTHFVFEARMMRELAAKHKVQTQMGNQGSAENGLRRAVELIQGGVLGNVTEVHVWTNRPVWPQAPDIVQRPATAPAPSHVHWDEFIGPAPMREYHKSLHPFSWRGFWDFGTGALGDMCCHTANMPFRALKLQFPTAVAAISGPLNNETYPAYAAVVYEFPARDNMPPVKLYWYEGRVLLPDGRKASLVLPPKDLLDKVMTPGERLADSGCLIVGSKGILFSPNDYGAKYRLVMSDKKVAKEDIDKMMDASSGPAASLPRTPANMVNKTDTYMKQEWVAAINGGPAAYSNFDYAGQFTETMLLGNIAIKQGGKRLEWDGPNMKFTNSTEANALVQPEYRKGWTL